MFSLFIGFLNIAFKENDMMREMSILGQNHLSNYETYLYRYYGLYGVKVNDSQGYFHHSRVKRDPAYKLDFKEPLSDESVLRGQILNIMALKLPANLVDQLLLKLDIFHSIAETQEAFEIKDLITIVLKDLEKNYEEVVDESIIANNFDWKAVLAKGEAINQEWLKFKIALKNLKLQKEWLEYQLDQAERDQYETYLLEISRIDTSIAEVTVSLEAVYENGKDLLKKLENQSYTLVHVLDEMIRLYDRVALIKEQIEILRGAIEDIEIDTIAQQLIKEVDSIEDTLLLFPHQSLIIAPDLEQYIGHSIDPEWVSVLMMPYENIVLLDQVIYRLNLERFESSQMQKDLLDLDIIKTLKTYQSLETLDDLRGQVFDLENKAYMDQFVFNYEPMTFSGKSIESHGESHFNLLDFLSVQINYEQIMINEYILGALKSYVADSDGHYDYYGKHDRGGCLEKCEVEYILMGNASESANLAATSLLLYASRTAMNMVHIYMDPDKLAYSKSIGLSLAGWTGFGELVVTHGLRVAWAMGESIIDMNNLMGGGNVALLKMSAAEWQLDLGFTSQMEGVESVTMNYHDYLRLYLLLVPEKLKMDRLIGLLNENLKKEGQSDLSDLYTLIQVIAPSGKILEEGF